MTSDPSDLRPTPAVRTVAGLVSGLDLGGVSAFKGVPYADGRAEVARFRPAGPPRAWSGVRQTVSPGPICPQNDDDGIGAMAEFIQDEDCLNLNIWTPALDGRRPVFVWFHGGGFTTGSGSLSLYDGAALARAHGLVVVTVNYRLGVFGWPPFQAHGPEVSNNLGLLDCIAALDWVRENIAAFGGDPDNVTQSGQSAGGMISAVLGLVAPQAAFAKAMPLSLQTLVGLEPERQAAYAGEVLAALELADGDLDGLARASAADLLRAQHVVRQRALRGLDPTAQIRWPFMPNRDGLLIQGDPADLVRATPRTRPLLTGYTTEELVVTPLQLNANPTAAELSTRAVCEAGLAKLFGAEAAARVWAVYASAYPHAGESDLAGLIATDKDYRVPALRLAEARGTAEAFVYAFAYSGRGPYFTNAHHALDLPFWFGTLTEPRLARLFLGGPPTEGDLALSARMQAALAGFCRDGAPGWPRYDARRATAILDVGTGVEPDPQPLTRAVWETLLP